MSACAWRYVLRTPDNRQQLKLSLSLFLSPSSSLGSEKTSAPLTLTHFSLSTSQTNVETMNHLVVLSVTTSSMLICTGFCDGFEAGFQEVFWAKFQI